MRKKIEYKAGLIKILCDSTIQHRYERDRDLKGDNKRHRKIVLHYFIILWIYFYKTKFKLFKTNSGWADRLISLNHSPHPLALCKDFPIVSHWLQHNVYVICGSQLYAWKIYDYLIQWNTCWSSFICSHSWTFICNPVLSNFAIKKYPSLWTHFKCYFTMTFSF